MSVIVIGAGYWGAPITHTLRNAGKTVICLDDQDPLSGSRNAAAIIAPHVYRTDKLKGMLPEGWTQADIDQSVAWATKMGRGVEYQEGFLNIMPSAASATVRIPDKWATSVHFPEGAIIDLVEPRQEKVCTIRHGEGGWNVVTTVQTYVADTVVIAAGYRTDEVVKLAGLPPIGVQKVFGRGIVGTGTPIHRLPLAVMTRPYTKMGLREWGPGQFYVGATKERTPHESNRDALDRLAEKMVTGWTLVKRMEGYRPATGDKFILREIAPKLIVATGGNRFGLGVAYQVANHIRGMVQ